MLFAQQQQESFQKALRSLETGCDGWSLPRKWKRLDSSQLVYRLRVPNPERVLVIKQVLTADCCAASLCRCFIKHACASASTCTHEKTASLLTAGMHVSGASPALAPPKAMSDKASVLQQAFEDGLTQADIKEYTQMDPWFIEQLWELHQVSGS